MKQLGHSSVMYFYSFSCKFITIPFCFTCTYMELKAEQSLKNGEKLNDTLVAQMVAEKLNSSGVAHYGNNQLHAHVVDCLSMRKRL